MESHTQSVTSAVQSSDYARLSVIFTSQWSSLGQVSFMATRVPSQFILALLFCNVVIINILALKTPPVFSPPNPYLICRVNNAHLPPTS